MLSTLYSALGQESAQTICAKADAFYFAEKLDSALYYYQLIVDQFPCHSSFVKSLNNIAYISWDLKKYTVAKDAFTRVLERKNNCLDSSEGFSMYENTRNKACLDLADICIEMSDFKSALKYLKLSENKYPFKHFCGNAYAGHRVGMAIRYSECYDALKDNKNAINVLWNYIFPTPISGKDNDASEQMKIVLLKKYSKKEIEQEIRNAEKTIKITSDDDNEVATIVLFNNKIKLWEVFMGFDKTTPETEAKKIADYQRLYRNSNFYKLFMSNVPAN